MLEALKRHAAVQELLGPFKIKSWARVSRQGKGRSRDSFKVDQNQAEIIKPTMTTWKSRFKWKKKLAWRCDTNAVRDAVKRLEKTALTIRRIWPYHARCGWDLGTNGACKCRFITEDKVRPDGGLMIRSLDAEVDFLPQVHGSGLFTRGQTQALSSLDPGSYGWNQIIDSLDDEYKTLLHHYNFLTQYSVWLNGRYGAPAAGRLVTVLSGERALSKSCQVWKFPLRCIRLVARVLESNGSSLHRPLSVQGPWPWWLVVCRWALLQGLPWVWFQMGPTILFYWYQGLEDHFGDMDFKVAGTRRRLPPAQMDIKIAGITPQILEVCSG